MVDKWRREFRTRPSLSAFEFYTHMSQISFSRVSTMAHPYSFINIPDGVDALFVSIWPWKSTCGVLCFFEFFGAGKEGIEIDKKYDCENAESRSTDD